MKWPIPKIRERTAHAQASIHDGQTLVLGNFSDEVTIKTPDGKEIKERYSSNSYKQLLVFITATRVESSGNRIHSEDYYDSPGIGSGGGFGGGFRGGGQ